MLLRILGIHKRFDIVADDFQRGLQNGGHGFGRKQFPALRVGERSQRALDQLLKDFLIAEEIGILSHGPEGALVEGFQRLVGEEVFLAAHPFQQLRQAGMDQTPGGFIARNEQVRVAGHRARRAAQDAGPDALRQTLPAQQIPLRGGRVDVIHKRFRHAAEQRLRPLVIRQEARVLAERMQRRGQHTAENFRRRAFREVHVRDAHQEGLNHAAGRRVLAERRRVRGEIVYADFDDRPQDALPGRLGAEALLNLLECVQPQDDFRCGLNRAGGRGHAGINGPQRFVGENFAVAIQAGIRTVRAGQTPIFSAIKKIHGVRVDDVAEQIPHWQQQGTFDGRVHQNVIDFASEFDAGFDGEECERGINHGIGVVVELW